MATKGEGTKKHILRATARLLDKTTDVDALSIRTIARAAGVSPAAINYYFVSKEKLLIDAVNAAQKRALDDWSALNKTLDVPPEIKLRILCKDMGRFYAEHRTAALLSLNKDLFLGWDSPSRARFRQTFLVPVLKSINKEKSEQDLLFISGIMIDTFDLTFLRSVSRRDGAIPDFSNQKERDGFIDRLIDCAMWLYMKD